MYSDTLAQSYGSYIIADNLWRDWYGENEYSGHQEFGLWGYVDIPNNQEYGFYDLEVTY